ncbi:MAG: bifunctional 4-hydroxy-2-oxoglutarate aldolase/2-dehydro-3-deoxy-phosphogluconate aldolase [Cyanobacteria bacterium P01_E01_bin.35]
MEPWLQLLQQQKAIAVIRCSSYHLAHNMAQAVAMAGMKLIEITWNSERPGDLIAQLRSELPQCTIGTGTVLNSRQLHDAIAAGAEFVFAPHFDPPLLKIAQSRYEVPFIPGVLTPSEIVNAWQQGARAVKVFPIKSLGGAEYLRCLQSPLGHIPLIPTGGITVDNALTMINSGAIAVGISSNLFPPQAIASQDWSSITHRAQVLLHTLQTPKSEKIPK